MKKTVFELRNNKRVQAVREKMQAPKDRISRKAKNFSLVVECAADYPCRVPKLENLNHELLRKKLYSDMKPVSLFSREFLVSAGCEGEFRSIAREHGFRAMEVMICE